MKDRFENIDRIIIDYLNNSISKSDLETLSSWCKTSKDNQKEFDDMKFLWEKSSHIKVFDQINIKEDWESVKHKTLQNPNRSIKGVNKANKVFSLRSIAAVLTPLIIVSVSLYMYLNVPGFGRLTSYKTENKIEEFILPDSSVVVLNKNSKVVFNKNIAKSNVRELKLKGEGYFSVTHNKTPFIVEAKNTKIQVLGTEFNVNEKNKNVIVSVVSGKVNVKIDKASVLLTKGEKAIAYSDFIKQETIITFEDTYWKVNELNFEQATLKEICTQLKKTFTEIKQLKLNYTDNNTKLTTSFKNQSLKEIIEELKLHFNKKITFDGKTLTISD